MKWAISPVIFLFLALAPGPARAGSVKVGPFVVSHLYHATVWIRYTGGKQPINIAVDPWSKATFPRKQAADLILITDVHFDHFDPPAIRRVASPRAIIVAPPAVAREGQAKLKSYTWRVLKNGESVTLKGIHIRTVPMYNTSEDRIQYHPRGRGNGYILQAGRTSIYIAGDTQCTPEMKRLKNIDLALIPINLPYTMDAREAADCVAAFRPKRVMPYHFAIGDAKPDLFKRLVQKLRGVSFVEP